jgi:hypothetical protein
LKVSVGTLYYNIDHLRGLIGQDENKKYILTSRGQIAYNILIESEEKFNSFGVEAERRVGWINVLSRVLFAHGLFNYIFTSIKLSIPSAITIILYGIWINYQAQLFPLVFLYSEKPSMSPVLTSILFLSGLIFVNVIGNLIPRIFYHRPLRDGFDCLLIGSCYAFLPSLVLPTIWTICHLLYWRLDLIVAQLIMFLSAGYSLCLFTTAVSASKGLRIEKAASITLTILYLILALALIFH